MVSEEVPPAVKAARAQLEINGPSPCPNIARSRSPSGRVDRSRGGSFRNTAQVKFNLDDHQLVTHSGETLVRHRVNAPWAPSSREGSATRGSISLAIEVASSTEKRREAMDVFENLTFAPGTVSSKNSLFSTLSRVCCAAGLTVLPTSPNCLRTVSGILRSSGYRAVKSFVFEVKDRHRRAGYEWSQELDAVVQDCQRMSDRAIGAPHRSAEVRPEYWAKFLEVFGRDPSKEDAAGDSPNSGVLAWILGTSFVLREVELSALVLHRDCIRFDFQKQIVTICLPVSKTDPSGRGAIRSLGCNCTQVRSWICPYHAASDLVQSQCDRLGISAIGQFDSCFPVIGARNDPRQFVAKRQLVDEVRRHVEILNTLLDPDQAIPSGLVSGHVFRRSGCKALARRGVSFNSIQWLARHSSQVTWIYVEESWGESPQNALRIQNELELTETLAATLSRVSCVEDAVKDITKQIVAPLHADGFSVDCDDFKLAVKNEVKGLISPKFVINLSSRVAHTPCQASQLSSDPKTWATVCGWQWVTAGVLCKQIYHFDDIESEITLCKKCEATSIRNQI